MKSTLGGFQQGLGGFSGPSQPSSRGADVLNTDEVRLPAGQGQKNLYGGRLVTPTPLVYFGGDNIVPAGSQVTVDVTGTLGNRCTGFLILSVVGTVQYAVNGGGLRTLTSALAVSDAQISSLYIQTGAGSSCIYQLQGV